MHASTIIQQAKAVGVILEAKGGRVIARPGSRLTPDLREAIRTNKADVLAVLVSERYSVTLADLRQAAGADWPEVEADPALLETFARVVQIRHMRERGEVPPHYTATVVCRWCGPVPTFEGHTDGKHGCMWCFNRMAGRPVPKQHGIKKAFSGVIQSVTPKGKS